ncbi:MAG TPA: MBL fold metallo-hydrolase [Chloroflexota bacterium]|nr:MBL fold metallo-hydrolase [Chloroflexota bacterium]
MSVAQRTTDAYRQSCEEIADGVFVYLSGHGGPNASFIVGREGVVLIDTLMTPRMSLALRQAIRRITRKPVRLVIYTHHHGDHVLGCERFTPPGVVIAHENTRLRLEELGQEYIALFQTWRRTLQDARDVGRVKRLIYPDITFKDALTLYHEDLRLELKFAGPAHTSNDLVVHIPQREVLILGDLVAYRMVPGMRDSRTPSWIARLDELYTWAPRLLVPGHGTWTEEREIITENRAFLQEMWVASKAGYEAGRSWEDVYTALDLPRRWGHLHGLNRAHEVIRRMYEELAGVPDYDTSAFRKPAALA